MRDFIKAIRDYAARHATQPAAKALVEEANKLLEGGADAIRSIGAQTGGSMQGPLSSLIQDVRSDVADIGADLAALKDKTLTIPMMLRTIEDLVRTVKDLEAELASLKKKQTATPAS